MGGTEIRLLPDTGWILPTLQTDMTENVTWAHLGYRRRNGITYVVLSVDVANPAANKLVFTLPIGFRPGGSSRRTVLSGASGQIRVDPANGEVRTNSTAVSVILAGSFIAEH